MKEVSRHYTHGFLEHAILDALEESGKDINRLTIEDLAPIDEFHVRGRDATRELAAGLDLTGDIELLDVGCGLGGASRRLASEYGCHITGVDLTEEYCEVATALGNRLGLSTHVDYKPANALDLPFDDASFDVVWTQHVAMNIEDKPQLYAEMARVLKPGGRLAIYDIVQGPDGEALFPVPWARQSDISFLVNPNELQELLSDAGFHIESWQDTTDAGRRWFQRVNDKIEQSGPAPLGLQVLLGDDFREMAANQIRNLNENRIALLQVVALRS